MRIVNKKLQKNSLIFNIIFLGFQKLKINNWGLFKTMSTDPLNFQKSLQNSLNYFSQNFS